VKNFVLLVPIGIALRVAQGFFRGVMVRQPFGSGLSFTARFSRLSISKPSLEGCHAMPNYRTRWNARVDDGPNSVQTSTVHPKLVTEPIDFLHFVLQAGH
jgi:hypothetical protein